MAGKPGRSGGHNRKSLAELQLSGTLRRARHLAQPIAPQDPAKALRKWKAFRKRLDDAVAAPGWNPLDDYAAAVTGGRVPAGRYHRLACARHVRDIARQGTAAFPFRLDLDQVARFLVFVKELKHYKGEWAGHTIVLEPHQVFRLGSMFGWVHVETGLRRFRRAYHEIPRKNGKSLEAAAVALYATFFDGEGGAEGYCAATKKDQARVVWGDAAQLVKTSILSVGIEAFARNLNDPLTMSKLEPLGSDADSTDGLNPHLIIHDEFHAQKDRRMIDVLETATGARRQPVDMRITTAGDDPVSPCGDEHAYAVQVLEQAATDETYFAFIASADPDDPWTAEETWRKANPNYGVSVKPDDLRALCAKAIAMPAAAAQFQQKRLNLWVNASAPCLSMDGWRKGQSQWTLEDMAGESCYVGVDLASKIDLCSLSVLFPPAVGRVSWRLLQYIWTPAATLQDRAHRDRAPYDVWATQGWLRTPPGVELDHNVIREVLRQLRTVVDIEEIGFDPWHAHDVIRDLKAEDGFPETQVLAVPQTYAGLSNAELTFQAAVLSGHVDARGCPVTSWAASNTVSQEDGKGNIFFTKKKSRGRIDPIKSATIAMSLALRHPVAIEPTYTVRFYGGAR
jgi:phage terminase large subunit-like protein